jgi:hypothetical protein
VDSDLDVEHIEAANDKFHTNGTWRHPLPGSPFGGEFCQIKAGEALPAGGYPVPRTVFSVPSVDWDALMSSALANANPNRASVDLPLFVFELKDIPELMRHTRSFYKHVKDDDRASLLSAPSLGKNNLAYRFGIKPMIDDLIKLMDFTALVAGRLKHLQELAEGTRLHRSLGSSNLTGNYTTDSSYWSNPHVDCTGLQMAKAVSGPIPWNGTRTIWYTMNAKLLTELPPILLDRRKLAAKITAGLYLDLDFAWNAIPFSWLVDWFTNFGELIGQTRGSLRGTYTNLNIMVQDSCSATIQWQLATGMLGPATSDVKYVRKRRKHWIQPYNFPTVSYPLLDSTQIGILASLALTGKGGAIRN